MSPNLRKRRSPAAKKRNRRARQLRSASRRRTVRQKGRGREG